MIVVYVRSMGLKRLRCAGAARSSIVSTRVTPRELADLELIAKQFGVTRAEVLGYMLDVFLSNRRECVNLLWCVGDTKLQHEWMCARARLR